MFKFRNTRQTLCYQLFSNRKQIMLEGIGPHELANMHGIMESTFDVHICVCKHVKVEIEVVCDLTNASVTKQRTQFMKLIKVILQGVIHHERMLTVADGVAERKIVRYVLATSLNVAAHHICRHTVIMNASICEGLSIYCNVLLTRQEAKLIRFNHVQYLLCSSLNELRFLQLTECGRIVSRGSSRYDCHVCLCFDCHEPNSFRRLVY